MLLHNIININLIIFFSSINFILNEGCRYIDEKDFQLNNGVNITTDNNYLNNTGGAAEKIQKCFSLSNSFVENNKCCYNNATNSCETEDKSKNNLICPNDTIISNNCGLSGVYQPNNPSLCTEIPLVKGYCCYVKFKYHGSSCIRTNTLNKIKNSKTSDIIKFSTLNKKEVEIESVICFGNFKKLSYLIFIFILFIQ